LRFTARLVCSTSFAAGRAPLHVPLPGSLLHFICFARDVYHARLPRCRLPRDNHAALSRFLRFGWFAFAARGLPLLRLRFPVCRICRFGFTHACTAPHTAPLPTFTLLLRLQFIYRSATHIAVHRVPRVVRAPLVGCWRKPSRFTLRVRDDAARLNAAFPHRAPVHATGSLPILVYAACNTHCGRAHARGFAVYGTTHVCPVWFARFALLVRSGLYTYTATHRWVYLLVLRHCFTCLLFAVAFSFYDTYTHTVVYLWDGGRATLLPAPFVPCRWFGSRCPYTFTHTPHVAFYRFPVYVAPRFYLRFTGCCGCYVTTHTVGLRFTSYGCTSLRLLPFGCYTRLPVRFVRTFAFTFRFVHLPYAGSGLFGCAGLVCVWLRIFAAFGFCHAVRVCLTATLVPVCPPAVYRFHLHLVLTFRCVYTVAVRFPRFRLPFTFRAAVAHTPQFLLHLRRFVSGFTFLFVLHTERPRTLYGSTAQLRAVCLLVACGFPAPPHTVCVYPTRFTVLTCPLTPLGLPAFTFDFTRARAAHTPPVPCRSTFTVHRRLPLHTIPPAVPVPVRLQPTAGFGLGLTRARFTHITRRPRTPVAAGCHAAVHRSGLVRFVARGCGFTALVWFAFGLRAHFARLVCPPRFEHLRFVLTPPVCADAVYRILLIAGFAVAACPTAVTPFTARCRLIHTTRLYICSTHTTFVYGCYTRTHAFTHTTHVGALRLPTVCAPAVCYRYTRIYRSPPLCTAARYLPADVYCTRSTARRVPVYCRAVLRIYRVPSPATTRFCYCRLPCTHTIAVCCTAPAGLPAATRAYGCVTHHGSATYRGLRWTLRVLVLPSVPVRGFMTAVCGSHAHLRAAVPAAFLLPYLPVPTYCTHRLRVTLPDTTPRVYLVTGYTRTFAPRLRLGCYPRFDYARCLTLPTTCLPPALTGSTLLLPAVTTPPHRFAAFTFTLRFGLPLRALRVCLRTYYAVYYGSFTTHPHLRTFAYTARFTCRAWLRCRVLTATVPVLAFWFCLPTHVPVT